MVPQKLDPDPSGLSVEVVHRLATRLIPGSRVSIWQVTERQLTVLTGAEHSSDGASLISSVLETGTAMTTITSDSNEWTHVVPLTLHDELAGLLVVAYPIPERGEKADLELLDLLSDYTRSILSHSRLLRQITRAKLEWERTFDALGAPLMLVTPDYIVKRANSGAAEVNKLTPKQFVGKRCHEIFRQLPAPCPGCPLPRLMEMKEPAFLELENVLGDRVHHAYFYPLIDEGGQVEAVVEHVLDVTHQMRTRASLIQVQKAHAVSTMVSGIAHNFSNYLEAMLGQADSLREHIMDPSALHELEALQQTALDAAELIRRLREFSQKGRPGARRVPIDINDLVRDVLNLLSLKDRQPPVTLSLSLGQIHHIQGNALELKEVLLNLFFNALDAMPSGGSLTVTTRAVSNGSPSQTTVEVTVTDTGMGMPDDVRLRAFDPFFTTKEGHGTGLGLSVSYGVIRQHGGTIECQSQPGRGSQFMIHLPAITSSASTTPEPPPIRPRALVVDDNEAVVASLVELLSSLGCDVTSAVTGHEALSLFSPGAYDVVFTDLAMPDLSGMQVAKAIRELDRTIPILLVSGWGQHNLQEQLTAYRVTFLEKPFSYSRIQSILTEAVSLRNFRDDHRPSHTCP